MGVSRDGIEVVAPSPATAADAAIRAARHSWYRTNDHEIVTVIEGEGAHAADTRRIVEWLAGKASRDCVGGAPWGPARLPLSFQRRVSTAQDERRHEEPGRTS